MTGDEGPCRPVADWLREVVPAGVAVAVGRIASVPPFDASEAAIVADAMPRRRAAFATGRNLARVALAELGCAPCALPRDADGVPCWSAGFVGTISHTDALCIALAARTPGLAGIGVDIEVAARVVPSLRRLVCRKEEGQRDGDGDVALRFAAKEAVFKACFPARRRMLGFQEVRLAMSPRRGQFIAQLMQVPGCGGERYSGRMGRVGAHVVAVAWRTGTFGGTWPLA